MAFGSGVNSSVLLKNTLAKAFAPNWMSLIFGWGLAVTFAVYIGIALGGPAHLNPAITISFAAGGLFPWDQVLPVVAAQMLGGFVGSAITMIHYFPHFKQTGPDEGNVVGIFATGFALNPARDFGPRLAYAILPVPNRGTANWGYAWVPVIGPIIGATIAVLFFLAVAPK